jgi:hypothetical protein
MFYFEALEKPEFSEHSTYSSQITVDSFFNYLYYLPQTSPFDSS